MNLMFPPLLYFFKLYLITLPVFFAIDMVWLGLIAKNFYAAQIGHLMAEKVNFLSAIIFYLIFIAGLVVFVISPGLKSGNLAQVIFSGVLFGIVTYATYDLTNLATLKNWPLLVTVVDLIWGAVLSAGVSAVAYLIAKRFGL